MALPDRSEVENCLKSIESVLYDIVQGAWNDWLESTEFMRTRYARTRANIVWDRMIDRALEVLPSKPDIQYFEHVNTISFVICNNVQFRFKKGNAKGLSNNFPTQLALAYHDHEQMLLPGFKELVRVEIVYNLNKTETQIDNVLVVARNNNDIVWSYEIRPRTSAIEIFPEATEQKSATSDLLRARRNVEKGKKNERRA